MEHIRGIQDPITACNLSKAQFEETYGALLAEFDGEDPVASINFFMEINPLNRSNLVFQGEREKGDFVEWAVDKGCIPELVEIHCGETQEEEKIRKEAAASQSDGPRAEVLRARAERKRAKRDAKRLRVIARQRKDAARGL